MSFPFEEVADGIIDIVNKFVPDPQAKLDVQKALNDLVAAGKQAQVDIDKAEVQSGSWLGKWRGFLGWALAGSAIYQFIIYPFWVSILLAFDPKYPVEKLPVLDWKQIGSILLGMLGLGS